MKERLADRALFFRGKSVLVWFCRGQRDERAAMQYLASRLRHDPEGNLARWRRLMQTSGAITVTRLGLTYKARGDKRASPVAAVFFRRRYFSVEAAAHEACHAYRFLFRRKMVRDVLTPVSQSEEHQANVVGRLAQAFFKLGTQSYRRSR